MYKSVYENIILIISLSNTIKDKIFFHTYPEEIVISFFNPCKPMYDSKRSSVRYDLAMHYRPTMDSFEMTNAIDKNTQYRHYHK